jgi:hypothetical protein
MGWFTNYEVEFDELVDWNDNTVKHRLEPFNVEHMYLRDLELPRVILCLYSPHNTIEEILTVLKNVYPVTMRYQIYNTGKWIKFV